MQFLTLTLGWRDAPSPEVTINLSRILFMLPVSESPTHHAGTEIYMENSENYSVRVKEPLNTILACISP